MPPPSREDDSPDVSQRARDWAATMTGQQLAPTIRTAHADRSSPCTVGRPVDRETRETIEDRTMSPEATRAIGAGNRALSEAPDPLRTCFERDRDRILHANAFRRLAGKTQVFVAPADHQRTRLTHALEVAQVARSLAAALGLNVALAEAIALGHDCGHGPGGHASEDALSPFIPEGYDHAVWGADVSLADLNLCLETLDGVRNHSWSRPAPSTPEGEITSWADRIAYVCHDFEDAVAAGVVSEDELPESVVGQCGRTRREQLAAFIGGVVDGVLTSGMVAMAEPMADALADFRRFNYHHIYLRDVSRTQASRVVAVLSALVEHYASHPGDLPDSFSDGVDATKTPTAYRSAVTYVGGMTDQFAFETAVRLLDWDRSQLPIGIDVAHH